MTTPAPDARTAASSPADAARRYPLLALLDGTRGSVAVPFATDPHAPRLEARARTLADAYWPNALWLTGRVSTTLLDAVVVRLEAERQSLRAGVRIFVATERPTRTSA